MIIQEKNFGSQILENFGVEIFTRENCKAKNFNWEKLWSPKFVSEKIVELKICLGRNCGAQNLSRKKLWSPKFFSEKIVEPKIFPGKNCRAQNFSRKKL